MIAGFRSVWFAVVAAAVLLAACEKQPDSNQPLFYLETNTRCDLEPGCVAAGGDFSGSFLIGPGALALQPFSVRVQVPDDFPIAAVSAEFVMAEMNMGINRYQLIDAGNGVWRADVTLPVCTSGRADWVAKFEVLTDRRRIRLDAPFSLAKQ